MCRSDDENNEIYPESYKSDVENSIPVAAKKQLMGHRKSDMALTHC